MMMVAAAIVGVLFTIATYTASKGLREEFTWTRVRYQWPQDGGGAATATQSRYGYMKPTNDGIAFPDDTKLQEKLTGNEAAAEPPPNSGISYNYENNIPMGANMWRDKLFITVPRRRFGIPSTLNFVWTSSKRHHNLALIPYPSWEMNSLPNNDAATQTGHRFVSVYRVAVDDVCNRLWFVDTGLIEQPGNRTQVKPATLYIMDLNTDQIVQSHEIPTDYLRPATTLASVTVDVEAGKCDAAFAYLPDLGGYGLIVYNFKTNRSWRVSHNFFSFDPVAGDFSIGGHNFQWNDGIFSVELTEILSDGHRDMYFHSMAGTYLYKVSTKILRDETLATRSYHGEDFKVIGDRGKLSQTSSADIHKTSGVLFLGLVNQNALGCWKLKNRLQDISVIHNDNKKMIYPCDVKVYKDDVILLTNSMPVFLYGRLNYDETNFRVWIQDVKTAVKGTKCE